MAVDSRLIARSDGACLEVLLLETCLFLFRILASRDAAEP